MPPESTPTPAVPQIAAPAPLSKITNPTIAGILSAIAAIVGLFVTQNLISNNDAQILTGIAAIVVPLGYTGVVLVIRLVHQHAASAVARENAAAARMDALTTALDNMATQIQLPGPAPTAVLEEVTPRPAAKAPRRSRSKPKPAPVEASG